MKFGAFLDEHQVEKFHAHYLPYNELKKELKELGGLPADTQRDIRDLSSGARPGFAKQKTFYQRDHDILGKLEAEIARINSFVATKLREIERELLSLLKRPQRARADTVASDIIDLDSFVRQNREAIRKILKKHDKMTGMAVSGWFLSKASETALFTVVMDQALFFLSQVYSALNDSKESATWNPPTSFERQTTKYWVRLEDLCSVIVTIVRELPILVFGRDNLSSQEHAKDLERLIAREGALHGESLLQQISSVYFDNANFSFYHSRINREEGALLFRMRWYGSDTNTVFVERKTHHESWVSEKSKKERFQMKRRQVPKYVEGAWTYADHIRALEKQNAPEQQIESERKSQELADDIQAQIMKSKIEPKLRTVYRRMAMQRSDTNAVRVSIDTDLYVIRETPLSKDGLIFRDVSIPVPKEDFEHFPFAVLEVKLQDKEPEWVANLLATGKLMECYKFSKFQHGVATLYPEMLQELPRWVTDEMYQTRLKERLQSISHSASESGPRSAESTAAIVSGEERESQEKEYVKAMQSEPSAESVPQGAESHSKAMGNAESSVASKDLHDAPVFIDSSLETRRRASTLTRILEKFRGRSSAYADLEEGGGGRPLGSVAAATAGISKGSDSMVPIRKPAMKIEPKTYFANERTFLQWLNTVILLAMSSTGLMTVGVRAAQVAGFLLCPLAILFALYALHVYRKRLNALEKRIPLRFDDRNGPVFLTVFLITALIITLIVTLWSK